MRPEVDENFGASEGRARPLHRSSLAARAAIVAAAIAAAVVLFVVLAGGGDDGTPQATAQTPAQSATRGQSQTPAAEKPKAQPEPSAGRQVTPKPPAVERIVVQGGKPVGGVKRLDYDRGERVRFTVRSDVADEVHVHGFDIAKDVRANGTVRFAFPADIEGVFEVELESGHVTIAKLRIRP